MINRCLEINELSFGYRKSSKNAISKLDLQIQQGDSFGLIGMNGAGKTTLVSLLMGLLKPTEGTISINGRPAKLGRTDIALIPQEYAFYGKLSASENLNYFASILNISGKQKQQSIQTVIRECNLSHLANTQSQFYSGGEKRRLNLAIGLLKPCDLLILDEPTANVDPHSRSIIIELIQNQCNNGSTIIYTSHLLSEVENLCRSIALIHDSQLKLCGNLQELLSEHKKILTIEFSSNILLDEQKLPSWMGTRNTTISIEPTELKMTPTAILYELEELGLSPLKIHYGHQSLEQLFLQLTHQESH